MLHQDLLLLSHSVPSAHGLNSLFEAPFVGLYYGHID